MNCLLPFLIVLQTTGITLVALDPSAASLGVAVTVDQRLYPTPAAQGVQHHPVLPALPQGPSQSRQLRRGVLGGVIGAVAGVATCTLISNVFFNEGSSGMSTCTTKGNLVFAGGGFAAGFAIGWFTGGDD